MLIEAVIPVVTSMRDLGATLAVGNAPSTKLSKQRLQHAGRTLHKVFALSHRRHDKIVIMRATCHSAALYGCEASHVDEASLAHYTAKVAHHLSPSGVNTSNSMIFTASDQQEDDPSVFIAIKRVTMLRRVVAKWPSLRARITGILQAYESQAAVGVKHDHTTIDDLTPSPPPGASDRYKWKQGITPHGPLGLFVQTLHGMAAAYSTNDDTNHAAAHVSFDAFPCHGNICELP